MIPPLVQTSQYVDKGLAMTDICVASNMASKTAVVSSSQMAARPAAAAAIEPFIRETINSFPQQWTVSLHLGEQYPTVEDTIWRLQAFAFCSGFIIVTASGTAERKRFKCVHHQQKPRNTRKLEDIPVSRQKYHEAVGISEEGNILRLRDGVFCGLDCKWEVYIARQVISGTGKREDFGTLGIRGMTRAEIVEQAAKRPKTKKVIKKAMVNTEPTPSIEPTIPLFERTIEVDIDAPRITRNRDQK